MMAARCTARGGGHAKRLARQTALAEEAAFRQDGNHGFFATLGYNRELHLAALDVEHRIRRVPLRKDGFITFVLWRLVFPAAVLSGKGQGSKAAAPFGSAPNLCRI